MRKPDLFIVGAPRCGTTALYTYLGRHPEIFMSPEKEPHYFAPDVGHPFRIPDLKDYLNCFAQANGKKRVGEASVWYLRSNCAADSIKSFSPDAKIIIMLRDPVEMMYSFHSFLVSIDHEPIPNFADALERKAKDGFCYHYDYRQLARFTEQVEKYIETFGRENVHIIIYDDFKNDTPGAYRETLRFLGVNTDFQPRFDVVNSNRQVRSRGIQHLLRNHHDVGPFPRLRRALIPLPLRFWVMDRITALNAAKKPRLPIQADLRKQLQEEFQPEVERLGGLLQRDLSGWYEIALEAQDRLKTSVSCGATNDAATLPISCPACGGTRLTTRAETFRSSSLMSCANCDVQFWYPVSMPSASWYEAAYQDRDKRVAPLEPGHLFFLGGKSAPKKGALLDVGCGTGNFLAAARAAGFEVTGIDFDRKAAEFARRHAAGTEVYALSLESFIRQRPQRKFDVVTFFEVLEHQAQPLDFLKAVKSCLKPGGWIALSVPNRNRWQRDIDTLDYPPNHMSRWSAGALKNFLSAQGFEVIAMEEQAVGVRRGAQALSGLLQSGMVSRIAGETPLMFRQLAQMDPEQIAAALERQTTSLRYRVASRLGQVKNLMLLPVAFVLVPYFRTRAYKGLYLSCLAKESSKM